MSDLALPLPCPVSASWEVSAWFSIAWCRCRAELFCKKVQFAHWDRGKRTGWVLTGGEKKNFEFTKPKSCAKWANYQLKQVKAMLENMIAKYFFFYFHAAAEIIYCCCCSSLFMALQFWHSHVIRPWFVCGCFCFVDLSHYWGEAIRDFHTPIRCALLTFTGKVHLCKPNCVYIYIFIFSWHRVFSFHPFVFRVLL